MKYLLYFSSVGDMIFVIQFRFLKEEVNLLFMFPEGQAVAIKDVEDLLVDVPESHTIEEGRMIPRLEMVTFQYNTITPTGITQGQIDSFEKS